MDQNQRQRLITLNNHFYALHAADFARTRGRPWAGWEQLPLPDSPTVLDVACGNLRFRDFIRVRFPAASYLGIDASAALASQGNPAAGEFLAVDILQSLLTGHDWRHELSRRDFNFIFCGAFLHHVPGDDWRQLFLHQLSELVPAGGRLAVSFWQFLDDSPQLVVEDLGAHDYLLSWGHSHAPARFVHHFTDKEIDNLAVSLSSLQVIADYRADGHTGRANRYLVWKKLKQ